MGLLDYRVFFSKIEIENNNIIVGALPLIDNSGNTIESFRLQIDFNHFVPKVFNLDGEIPIDIDRHVISIDGSCCIAPNMQIISFLRRNNYNKALYIKEKVIPFLCNQVYFARHGEWASGEFSHGSEGIYEFYKELFKTNNIIQIINSLKNIYNGNYHFERNWKCFCGSGVKYKNCHLRVMLGYEEKICILNDIDLLEKFQEIEIKKTPKK